MINITNILNKAHARIREKHPVHMGSKLCEMIGNGSGCDSCESLDGCRRMACCSFLASVVTDSMLMYKNRKCDIPDNYLKVFMSTMDLLSERSDNEGA